MALSPRRRAALRLDLEDLQATLITELYSFSVRHSTDESVRRLARGDWRIELTTSTLDGVGPGDGGPPLSAVHDRLERLYVVNRALARLDSEEYGACTACGERIDFELLASDPARQFCTGCSD
jgi:hypothetical protein